MKLTLKSCIEILDTFMDRLEIALSIDLTPLESGQVSGSTCFKSIYRNKRGGA